MQVPSSFSGEIEFAQLDLATNATLQCACNMGIQEELRKTTVGPLPRSVSIDVIDAGDVAWRLLDIKYDGNSSVAWLALAASNGTRSDPIRLDMNASGLAERGGDQGYEASVVLELIGDDFAARSVTIPVAVPVSDLPFLYQIHSSCIRFTVPDSDSLS